MSDSPATLAMLERQTICFPHHGTTGVLQPGQPGFMAELDRIYRPEESNATEKLIDLKNHLRSLPADDFFAAATEGMSQLLGADICFVMKRVLVDDQQSAVEMPPQGAVGSCLMAAALHYCATDGAKTTIKATKFHAYGCPCAYMRHDKVFLITDRLNDFITNNPNRLPTPCDAYIAVPLFAEGRCFAHFGAMWSVEAAAKRRMSWAFIEVLMHSLEDMICQRLVEGSTFIRPQQEADHIRVIPHDAITVAQSLRPYAGSLSHELRTPMQGVVGMLDVMYATVQEAVATQADPRLRQIFQTLKENIETVQDSSRRAVEAADNVVHAYDMDMSVPDAPAQYLHDLAAEPVSPNSLIPADRRPEILVAGSNLPLSRPNKRRRDPSRADFTESSPPKQARLEPPPPCRCSQPSPDIQTGVQPAQHVHNRAREGATIGDAPSMEDAVLTPGASAGGTRIIAPGLRHTSLRELMQYVINEGLKVGGRPDSAMAQETDLGETIEVRTRGSDGTSGSKMIEWSIEPNVPNTLFIDEKDFSKLMSCVFLNAVKFTGKVGGRVHIHAHTVRRSRFLTVEVSDNGPGIPAAFLPKLFTAFAQNNGSITRSSDGLGLGLMVAKGIARKLGGDLICTRADTEGGSRGTTFEIKVPLQAGETISRPSSPFGSPLPRRQGQTINDPPHMMPLPAGPHSARRLSRALHEAVSAPLTPTVPGLPPSTPPPLGHLLPGGPDSAIGQSSSPSSAGSPLPANDTSATSEPTCIRPIVRPRFRKSISNPEIDRNLAAKYPLTFLVAEDNKINRKLLVSMLGKFGYETIHEAHDGAEAVRQMSMPRSTEQKIDVVLMDLWMPLMDGYEATERILDMDHAPHHVCPTVLAVSADVTDGALARAAQVGMKGFMTKPYKLMDLQRLIEEYCAIH